MILNMRTIVDIPDNVIETLDHLGTKEHKSRAAIIREAVNCYLKEYYVHDSTGAYGLWKDDITDGVEFQRSIRSEWGE